MSAPRSVNAAVIGLLLAVFYAPVWTSIVKDTSDFAAVVIVAVLLSVWSARPFLVVFITAIAGSLNVYCETYVARLCSKIYIKM